MSLFENEINLDDLNHEFRNLYKLTGEDALINKIDKDIYLNEERLKNYNLYNKLDLEKLNKIPSIYKEDVSEILNIYNKIESNKLLKSDLKLTREYNKLILEIINKLSSLNDKIDKYVKNLTKLNDKKIEELRREIELFKDDLEYKKFEIDYDNLILSTAKIDVYDNISELINQLNIYKKINRFKDLLNTKRALKRKKDYNDNINYYTLKIEYLKDLILENSIYEHEFNLFVNSYSYIIDYSKKTDSQTLFNTNFEDKSKFMELFKYYETKFIEERKIRDQKENFIFEKTGNKNLINSMEFLLLNYKNILTIKEKDKITEIFSNINTLNLEYCSKEMAKIVNRLWNLEITKILEYNPKIDFNFIVTDSIRKTEFIKCKLLTSINYESRTLPKIGYICSYNDNIVLINENIDESNIYDDLSRLKTIRQLQKQNINFGLDEYILLNGYKTKIEGVYVLKDRTSDDYIEALNLANKYHLPLIEIKK